MSSTRLMLSTFALVAGCALSSDPTVAPSTFALTLPSTDAAQVLDLVNYPGADAYVLDEVAGLDSRAAESIVVHRAGADGVFPSGDDDLFEDIAELDAVPYVGDVAFSKLQAYAQAHPAPTAESVENVLFRGWESEIVVWGVNNAELGTLDGMLDARAAQNLYAARPFASVSAMGPIGYVGTSALERLRAEGSTWWAARTGGTSSGALAGTFDGVSFDEATAVVALDIANKATLENMTSHGIYSAGAAAIVGNRPYATVAAVSAVSGVGTSTTRGLHDYAAAGTWTPGSIDSPPPPPPVSPHTPPTNECAFGLVYRDIFRGEAIVVITRRTLNPTATTSTTERAQLVAAVQSAYADVTTSTQAFAAVDGGVVNQTEIWDASNRVPYMAYEFGAGDNSFGLIFEWNTTNVAARVIDGDLYDCTAMWGNERRTCERVEDCAEGLRCVGTADDMPTGRCIDTAAPDHQAEGTQCLLDSDCVSGSGLVCAGVSQWGPGLCRPAWMRGHFESDFDGASIPDAAPEGVTLSLPVYGLATVPTNVNLDLVIQHPRVADLSVTLINANGTETVVIAAGTRTGMELVLRDYVVRSFPGDEYVNGTWQIRVVDRASGSVGTVTHVGLTITSTWD